MAEEIVVNTFSDEDTERIIAVVRTVERTIPTIKDVRREVSPNESPIVHFKASTDIPGINETTGQMGSAAVTLYNCTTTGQVVVTNPAVTVTVYNPNVKTYPSNKFGIASYNEAGLLVLIEHYQTDVRVKPDGTALQKSFDGGATWIDWATIGPCS